MWPVWGEWEHRQHCGGPPREGQRCLEDRGDLLFTFALFAWRWCDISLFNLKSSANFVIFPSAWCTEKRMCHTSEAVESRTETAHMGERDNPKMEPFRLQQKSELRVKWKVYTTSPRTLRVWEGTMLPKLFQNTGIKGTCPTPFCNTWQNTHLWLTFTYLKKYKNPE